MPPSPAWRPEGSWSDRCASLPSALCPDPVIPSLVLPKSQNRSVLWSWRWVFPSFGAVRAAGVAVRLGTARRGGCIIPVINCIPLIVGESERLSDLGTFPWDLVDASRGIWCP